MKKAVCILMVAILVIGLATTAFAGKIVTPNGGRAKLWKSSDPGETVYKAYISSGNSATKQQANAVNNRYKVKAYGYNSKKVYGWYTGWIKTAYYQD